MSLERPPRTIHLWVPDIDSAKGGIQAFSRFFVRAVTDLFPDAQVSVFSKNDSAEPARQSDWPNVPFDCTGWWPRRQRTPAYGMLLLGHALREKPDLVVTTHANFAQLGYWLRKVKRVPFAVVAHGVDVWGLRHGIMRHSIRKADRILAVSNFTRDRVIAEMKVRPECVGLLPNTFDETQFVPGPKPHFLLRRFGLTPEQPVILTVARLASAERYKGYDQILQALPAVRAAVPNVRYLIVGSGPDRERVERVIRELQLGDSVHLAGYVPDHELPSYYRLSDVFAMPSKGEGFGIVFLEAMACGKPVIAGNKDGSVDAVLQGKAGVLIDPDDVGQLTTALVQTLTRQHPLAILQQPEQLHAAAVEAYGYEKFKEAVRENLAEL